VQGFPSSQAAVLLVNTQPDNGLHVSVVHGLVSLQTIAVPLHTPPLQTSPEVHTLWSLQAFVLLACTQPVAGLQESSVHGLLSSHATAAPP
jgi:hypothetical protein